jgi:hypothetical protein
MPKPTQHQRIWKRTQNGLKLTLPKKIKSDIGFQLIFGETEKHCEWVEKYEKHCRNYETKTYRDLKHLRRII